MKSYNVFYTLKGAGPKVEAPNVHNPVQQENLVACLQAIVDSMPPDGSLVAVVGVRVEEVPSDGR